jgi:hypothetical protein
VEIVKRAFFSIGFPHDENKRSGLITQP